MDQDTFTFTVAWTNAEALASPTPSKAPRFSCNVLMVLAAIFMSTAPSASAADHREMREQQAPVIRVCVMSLAGVDEKIVADALVRAEQIFQNANIRMTWLRKVPDSAPIANSAPSRLDHRDVRFVRIVRRAPPTLVGRTALGVAFPKTLYATLFYDRLATVAYNTGYPEAVVLGITIAHELGHLLLGTSTHTLAGLMAGCWFDTDLRRAAMGALVFSRVEAAGIRSHALRGRNAT